MLYLVNATFVTAFCDIPYINSQVFCQFNYKFLVANKKIYLFRLKNKGYVYLLIRNGVIQRHLLRELSSQFI